MRRRGTALLVATLLVASACSHGASSPQRRTADARAGERVVEQHLPGTPVAVANVDESPWVALQDAHALYDVDGHRHVALPGEPADLVGTPFGVWTTIHDGVAGYLVRVDARSGTVDKTVRLTRDDTDPTGISFDGRSLWVLDRRRQSVFPVNPVSGEVGPRLVVDRLPQEIDSTFGTTFVTGEGSTSVFGVHRRRGWGRPDAVGGVCRDPHAVLGAVLVWVACPDGDQLVGLQFHQPVEQVRLRIDHPSALALLHDDLVVVEAGGPVLDVVEQQSGHVLHRLRLGAHPPPLGRPLGLAGFLDEVVVVHPGLDTLWRIPGAVVLSDSS